MADIAASRTRARDAVAVRRHHIWNAYVRNPTVDSILLVYEFDAELTNGNKSRDRLPLSLLL